MLTRPARHLLTTSRSNTPPTTLSLSKGLSQTSNTQLNHSISSLFYAITTLRQRTVALKPSAVDIKHPTTHIKHSTSGIKHSTSDPRQRIVGYQTLDHPYAQCNTGSSECDIESYITRHRVSRMGSGDTKDPMPGLLNATSSLAHPTSRLYNGRSSLL